MGSKYNPWREPVGYTSSSRAIRTPMRLSYGREYTGIKETIGQRFQQQSSGRESLPRTFPMELTMLMHPLAHNHFQHLGTDHRFCAGTIGGPRESLFTYRYEPSRGFSRCRSTAREDYKDAMTVHDRSKKANYRRCQSTPREDLRDKITSRKSSSRHSQSTSRREDLKEPSYHHARSSGRQSRCKSTPRGDTAYKELSTPLVQSSKNSRTHPGHSTREDKKPSKVSNAPEKIPYGYIHSKESSPKKAPYGYIHAPSNRAPTSGNRDSSPRPRKEPVQSTSRPALVKKVTKIPDEDTPTRFLRSTSEPPRRSARIANLKKFDIQRGIENSTRPSTRSSSRARDTPCRDSSFDSKYRPHTNYRSVSVAPSGRSGRKSLFADHQTKDPNPSNQDEENAVAVGDILIGVEGPHPSNHNAENNVEIVNTKETTKEIQHSHKRRVSFDIPSRFSPAHLGMIKQSDIIDVTANRSMHSLAKDLRRSPVAGERSPQNDLAKIEDPNPSNQDEEDAVAIKDILIGVEGPHPSNHNAENNVEVVNTKESTDPSDEKGVENMDVINREEGPGPSNRKDAKNNVGNREEGFNPSNAKDTENIDVDGVDDSDPSDQEDAENMAVVIREESPDPSNEEDAENMAVVNREEDNVSPHEVQRWHYDNYYGEDYFAPYDHSRHYFANYNNPRQGLNATIPFHHRQMSVPQPFNNTPGFYSYAGSSLYGAPMWPSTSYDYQQISPVERYQHVSSWQSPYDERIQSNLWNSQTSTHIISPDGDIYRLNEEMYLFNRRVPTDDNDD